jgi:hypothetical protein
MRGHDHWANVSHGLAEEYLGLDEIEDGIWNVYYGPVLLGAFMNGITASMVRTTWTSCKLYRG